MTEKDDELRHRSDPADSDQGEHELDPDSLQLLPPEEASHAPLSGSFDDEESYEEPERDTDYSAVYADDELEEDLDPDDDWDDDPSPVAYTDHDEPAGEYDDKAPWLENETDELSPAPDTGDLWPESAVAQPEPGEDTHAPAAQIVPHTGESTPDEAAPQSAAAATAIDPEADVQPHPAEDADYAQGWPLGLIAVAVLALLLLLIGGYGVVQQRAATQEEIRQLQAALATASPADEMAGNREALQEAARENRRLQEVVDNLALENRRLVDTVAGLESQLDAQQVVTVTRQSPAPVTPQPVAKQEAAPPPESAAAAATGVPATPAVGWFVNFGTYGQRATAESWVGRLRPATGKVVVIAAAGGDGGTLYRVRVVALQNREQAEKVARQLEREYDLSRLWVGQQ